MDPTRDCISLHRRYSFRSCNFYLLAGLLFVIRDGNNSWPRTRRINHLDCGIKLRKLKCICNKFARGEEGGKIRRPLQSFFLRSLPKWKTIRFPCGFLFFSPWILRSSEKKKRREANLNKRAVRSRESPASGFACNRMHPE